MTAQDFPVTFGYKAQDGEFYGPNGLVGLYHRGNDRSTPTGTPIVIQGVTIGHTGATGKVGGPHLHTQAGTDVACQDTFDPTPLEFKPGKVVATGQGSQWGNYVTIKVGDRYITYAHLSWINVIVGQEIKEEDMKIPDNDAWFNRFNKLMVQIRNRQITREEFRKNFVGADAFRMVEVVSDHPEADRATALQKPTDAENKLIKIREIVK